MEEVGDPGGVSVNGTDVSAGPGVGVTMTGVNVANGSGVSGLTVQKTSEVLVGDGSVPHNELQAAKATIRNISMTVRNAGFIGCDYTAALPPDFSAMKKTSTN
jgi:hypothetical protein